MATYPCCGGIRPHTHGGVGHDHDRGGDVKPYYNDESVTDLAAGTAAEHLVCADLLMAGWRAFLADQNCPYDIAVDVGGRLVRIQVKSTRTVRTIPQRRTHIAGYMWHVRRAGKGGRRTYGPDEFDLLALVALDVRRIAYMPPSQHRMTVHLRPVDFVGRGGKRFDDYPFDRALAALNGDSDQPALNLESGA